MNAGAKTQLDARAPDLADEASARVVRALEENARLARATMLAIDRYVETWCASSPRVPAGRSKRDAEPPRSGSIGWKTTCLAG